VRRLKAALAAAQAPKVLARQVDVSQLGSNVGLPSLGASAVLVPTPRGYAVNPNPVTLAEVPQLWGFRSGQWDKGTPSYSGTLDSNASWFVPLLFQHRADTMVSGSLCAMHFKFDGSAFEVLFAGSDPSAVLLVNGQHAAARYITRSQLNGTPGAALSSYDTYVRFDFGSRAARNIALHCKSTIGPKALAIGAGDTLLPWGRSAETSMAVQADSYGQALSAFWGPAGLFCEAAELLGITHVDPDAIGGTGYAPNNTNSDTRNPGNAFPARLANMTQMAPDIFVTAGGINDNDSMAAPPLYDTVAAARLGFDTAVKRYFQQLRAALPETVLVALGPWQPNITYYPETARRKADTIKAALQAVAGPWIFVDNLSSGWLNSAGTEDAGSGIGWQTGTGNEGSRKGDGNGDLYLTADGVHPNEAGVAYLAGRLAGSIKAALDTL
jgi:lysophospholipase L1-like esterase